MRPNDRKISVLSPDRNRSVGGVFQIGNYNYFRVILSKLQYYAGREEQVRRVLIKIKISVFTQIIEELLCLTLQKDLYIIF